MYIFAIALFFFCGWSRPRKYWASVALSGFLKDMFMAFSIDNKLAKLFTLLGLLLGFYPGFFAGPSNPEPTPTIFLLPKYTKDNFKQIL